MPRDTDNSSLHNKNECMEIPTTVHCTTKMTHIFIGGHIAERKIWMECGETKHGPNWQECNDCFHYSNTVKDWHGLTRTEQANEVDHYMSALQAKFAAWDSMTFPWLITISGPVLEVGKEGSDKEIKTNLIRCPYLPLLYPQPTR